MESAVFSSLVALALSSTQGALQGRIKRVASSALSTVARFVKDVVRGSSMPLSLPLYSKVRRGVFGQADGRILLLVVILGVIPGP
jgi:hypothetical protein